MKKSLVFAVLIMLAGVSEMIALASVTNYNDGLRVVWGMPLAAMVCFLLSTFTGNEKVENLVAIFAAIVVSALVGLMLGAMIFEGVFGGITGVISIATYVAYSLR